MGMYSRIVCSISHILAARNEITIILLGVGSCTSGVCLGSRPSRNVLGGKPQGRMPDRVLL